MFRIFITFVARQRWDIVRFLAFECLYDLYIHGFNIFAISLDPVIDRESQTYVLSQIYLLQRDIVNFEINVHNYHFFSSSFQFMELVGIVSCTDSQAYAKSSSIDILE